MSKQEAPELLALAARMKSAVGTATRLTMFSEEENLDMADAVEFSETASMLGTVTPVKAARLAAIQSAGARMAADQVIHDAKTDELLNEALGGAEWLLGINDDEVED